MILARRNHDLKIFPGNTYVLRLNPNGFVGFVGRSEAISKIERPIAVRRPLLDVFQVLAGKHRFCIATLRRVREPPRQYMELSSCPRIPISINPRRRHQVLQNVGIWWRRSLRMMRNL
jgi:hypothetical protein